MKRIRLNEGQLHRLIEQTLNELDWRTYMNASQKSAYQIPDLYDQSLEEFGKAYNESNWDKPGHGGHSAKHKQLQNKIKKRAQQSNTFAQGATDAYRRKYGVDDINLYPPSEDYPMGCIGVPSKDKRMADIDRFHDFLYRDKYTKGKGWNESLARRVTESVVRKLRKLNEEYDNDLVTLCPDEALDLINNNKNGNEELFINGDEITFGLGDVYAWSDRVKEYLNNRGSQNANISQGGNDAFLHFDDDETLLDYLEWLENADGYLYFRTNTNEDGTSRPLENYL